MSGRKKGLLENDLRKRGKGTEETQNMKRRTSKIELYCIGKSSLVFRKKNKIFMLNM